MIEKQKRKIVLVGAGGHCRSVIDAALSSGFEIAGILDRTDSGTDSVLDYPIIGNDDDIPRLATDYDFVVTVGMIYSSDKRRQLHRLIADAGGRLATIIASTAYVSPYAHIGSGTVVLHQAVVNAGATVGCGCIINTAAVVDHDCRVGDYTHISTGAILNGAVEVGSDCMVGSHATLLQQVTIPSGTIIGAAALILHSIRRPGIYYGTNPKATQP